MNHEAVAQVFESAGHPRLAASILRNGEAWLATRRRMVESWAQQFGVDITAPMLGIGDLSFQEPPECNCEVDVVIPFCKSDSKYLAECLEGIFDQKHATLQVHVVADNCDFPELPEWMKQSCLKAYRSTEQLGPYCITNALVARGWLKSQWMALQDADDWSHPDRIWRQVQLMELAGAEMISSAMMNYLEPSEASDKWLQHQLACCRIIPPNRVFSSAPLGCCVNSTRTMSRDLFARLNGFMPLKCSADFEWDNRCRHVGVRVLDDHSILGHRRLHLGSLTNGSHRMGGHLRAAANDAVERALKAIKANPTEEEARLHGGIGGADIGNLLFPVDFVSVSVSANRVAD